MAAAILTATFAGTAVAQPCAKGSVIGEAGTLRGTVRDAAGTPLTGAGVVAAWQTWVYSGAKLSDGVREVTALTGADGRFELCPVPTLVRVTVHASAGRGASEPVTVSLRDGSPVVLDLSFGPAAAATIATSRGSITGSVSDSNGLPILGVRFTVAGSDVVAVSSEVGRFDLGGLASGEHVVTARRIGYRSQSQTVRVGTAATSVTVVLAAVAVPLTEVRALAELSAFERFSGFSERRRRGPGVFIDRADLETRRPHNLTDVIRTIPGFRIQPALTGWGYQEDTPTMARAPMGTRGCQIDYYVNGRAYTPTSLGIDNDIPPHQIEALEVYKPSEIPAQFLGTRSRCGAVVIWTRYRAHELSR